MLGAPSAIPIQLSVIGGGLLVVLAIVLILTYFGSVTGSSADSPVEEWAVDVTVKTVDESIGRTYPHADRVVARRVERDNPNGQQEASTDSEQRGIATDDSVQIELTSGEGAAEIEGGVWVFEAEQNGQTIGQRQYAIDSTFDTDRLSLPVDPYTVDVQVLGGPDREPLSGVAVDAAADVDGWEQRTPTDSGGRVQFEVPRSASTVAFTAEDEDLPAVESEQRVEEAATEGVTLEVGTGTGAMTLETAVGDRPWPEVEVRITPVSETAAAYTDEGVVTTKTEGSRTVEGMPTGEYEVRAHPQVESVDTTAATRSVTVVDGETAEITLSIGVSYSMDDAKRERLADLRDRIGDLAEHPDRDTAIPRYYGTVLTAMLELVTDVESAPERTVGRGVSPSATAEALLDATEAGLDAVTDAMSDRRVVSLFEACEPMSPVQVAWSTDPVLDAFLDRVRTGGDRERRKLRDRLRETDDFLNQRWSEVNESAPVRKLHDRLGEFARETGELDDELTVVARTVVAVCLLDAIEELFEHDALVERLNGRTL